MGLFPNLELMTLLLFALVVMAEPQPATITAAATLEKRGEFLGYTGSGSNWSPYTCDGNDIVYTMDSYAGCGPPDITELAMATACTGNRSVEYTDGDELPCDPGYACSTHKLVASSGDPNPWTLIGCVAEGSGPITIFENRPGEAGQTTRAGKETTQQRSTPTIPTKFGGKTGESGPGETAARKNSAVKGDTPAILSVTVAVLVSGWLVWTT